MSQQYTEVEWHDPAGGNPGTLINKARLDQMQTAHHYADGFEEVDTAPTADPGVGYHKIVYCTADSTFYRWDGTQWQKDIDDDTKALLLAHEADHDNPHEVTKAQVGLGNADNTSDADKPISTATQTALDGKVSIIPVTTGVKFYAQTSGGTYLYQGTQDATAGITSVPLRDSSGRIRTATPSGDTDAVPKKYADDGLATKADKATTYTKTEIDTVMATKADKATTLAGYGITDAYTKTEADTLLEAKANDNAVVKLTGDQTVAGSKTFTWITHHTTDGDVPRIDLKRTNLWADDNVSGSRRGAIIGFSDMADKTILKITPWKTTANTHLAVYASRGTYTDVWAGEVGVKTDGTAYAQAPTPGAGASSAEVATVGYIDGYTPMVRTTGNQTIAGAKTYTSPVTYNGADINAFLIKKTTLPADRTQRGASSTETDFTIQNSTGQSMFLVGMDDTATERRAKVNVFMPEGKGWVGLNIISNSAGTYMTGPSRAYSAGNTNDVATIGTLDAYTPMVRTSGNQSISGTKIFSGDVGITGAFNNKCKYYGYVSAAANYEKIATLTPGTLGGAFVGMIYSTKGQTSEFKNRHGIFYARVRNTDLQIIWMMKGSSIVEKQLYITYDGSKFELWGLVNYDAANEAMGFNLISESNAGTIPYNLVTINTDDIVKTEAELSQYQLSSYSQ